MTEGRTVDELETAINEMFLVVATAFILLMQLGFALLENGSVRSKNSKNILIKNLFDACAGALAFWLIGFGIAFGHKEEGGFIGTDGGYFASANFSEFEANQYLLFIFQFSFAATSSTIVSGSLAERTQLPAYMGFSILMTGFIYPVVVGWVWGGGWLGDVNENGKGFHDFAGTGLVHMVGGVAGFCGALIIGPRHGKEKDPADRRDVTETKEYRKLLNQQLAKQEFENWVVEMADDEFFEINSFPFIVFGTILLWVCWLFFNGGSTMTMFAPRANNAPKIIMNTMLSAVTGGLGSAFIKPIVMKTYSKQSRYDVAALSNGILVGLVAVTGVSDRCEPWSSIVIGLLASIVYSFACKLNSYVGVDDPIEASQVHGFTGMFGLIAVGIFDNEKGLVSDNPESGRFFGWQFLGMIVIILWVASISLVYFSVLKKFDLVRVPLLQEVIGLDLAEMGSQIKVDMKIAEGIVRHQTLNFNRASSYSNSVRPTYVEMQSDVGEHRIGKVQSRPFVSDSMEEP